MIKESSLIKESVLQLWTDVIHSRSMNSLITRNSLITVGLMRPVVPASPAVDRLSDVIFGLLGVGLVVVVAVVRAGRIERAGRPQAGSALLHDPA